MAHQATGAAAAAARPEPITGAGPGVDDPWNLTGPARYRGAAWPHGTGNGLSIQLEALPIGDRIVLTEPKADEAEAKAE